MKPETSSKKCVGQASRLPKNISEAMQRGIDFVAFNDEADDLDTKRIAGQLSVICLSESFGYSAKFFAIKIKQARIASGVIPFELRSGVR
jgi:hypothetical protein